MRLRTFLRTKKVNDFIGIIGNDLKYNSAEHSFSPHYSDIGLGFNKYLGISNLYLHYNRRTTVIDDSFLKFTINGRRLYAITLTSPLWVEQRASNEQFRINTRTVFSSRNTWMLEVLVENTGKREICFNLNISPFNEDARRNNITEFDDNGISYSQCMFKQVDPRDPDDYFPSRMGVKILPLQWDESHVDNDKIELRSQLIEKGRSKRFLLKFRIGCLDGSREKLKNLLSKDPSNIESAVELSEKWFLSNIKHVEIEAGSDEEKKMLSKAINTLIANECIAPGKLAGGVSTFPQRGTYATHFLWDSCFINLGLELMNVELAKDAILLLTENLREDGKMYQFICSTWARPKVSQSPSVGWAAWRLYELTGDKDFIIKVLPSLEKNIDWWFEYKDPTNCGIAECSNPLEVWDDTPRLDKGPIKITDINTYLWLQIEACVKMSKILGLHNNAAKWESKLKVFGEKIKSTFYCKEDNLFYDVLVKTGQYFKVKTPACFIPLLADTGLSDGKAKKMIKEYLLSKEYFWGKVPFPTVSYQDRYYQPDQWWRGPLWMPIGYLMLEILKKYGFAKEYRESAQKLCDIILKDGRLSELFNSKTGKGMGCPEQGWTAAVFIKLYCLLHSQ